MQTKLQEIRDRADKATVGPWKLWGMDVMHDPVGDSNIDTALLIANTEDPHRGLRTFNAEFIAHARQDVPYLLDAIERLENFIEKVLNQDIDVVNIASSLQQSQDRERVLRDALQKVEHMALTAELFGQKVYSMFADDRDEILKAIKQEDKQNA